MEDQNSNKIQKILDASGPRIKPSKAIHDDVHYEVHQLWQSTYKKPWIKTHAFKVAASFFMVLGVLFIFNINNTNDQEFTIASNIKLQGQVQFSHDNQKWSYLKSAESIKPGTLLKTVSNNRFLMFLDSNIIVKVDELTVIKVAKINEIELIDGRIYIDSNHSNDKLLVTVDSINMNHIGTQYSISKLNDDLQVSVREGIVELDHSGGVSQIDAGNQINLKPDGIVQLSKVSTFDEQWSWTQEIYTPFDINGKSVKQYLNWVSSETGYSLVWDSMQAKLHANKVKLSGSLEGIMPIDSLKVILPATRFNVSTNDHNILVRLSND